MYLGSQVLETPKIVMAMLLLKLAVIRNVMLPELALSKNLLASR
jgi:hypothetical protein